jgi:hypothetical protein
MSRLSEITQKQRERLRENTLKMTGGMPFITYKDGLFRMGEVDVTDTDYLAVIDRARAVWLCFLNGTVTELVRANMLDNDIPPKPKGYDDRDRWEKWETGKNKGEPKNPLTLQFELPLIDDDDQRIIMFKAQTKSAKDAVKRLLTAVNAEEQLRRPYVTLTINQQPNPNNTKQTLIVPDFTINDYSDDLSDIALPGDDEPSTNESEPSKPASTNGSGNFTIRTATNDPISTGTGTGATRPNGDMDDDIPF